MPHAMPNSVTQQVPETQNYEFVKLPDRVLRVDPTDRSIAAIVPTQAPLSPPGPRHHPERPLAEGLRRRVLAVSHPH